MHLTAPKHWHKVHVCLRLTVSIHEVTLIFLVISSLQLINFAPQVAAEEICGDIDIRNSVAQFSKLENCTVIEGVLQILLIDNAKPSDFLNLTFPKLHEITGFLLLYRVQGLTTLANIFPNLTVIRGAKLLQNFAFFVYQMQSLKEIGLPSLTVIQRGSVFIVGNSQLCYVDTIDWDLIVQNGRNDNFFKSNQESNQCPNNCPADTNCPIKNVKGRDVRLCWNKHHCQKTCPPRCKYCTSSGDNCCHESCLGGCSGLGRDSCFACTHFVFRGKCLNKCSPGTFEFANRRCITDKECLKMDTKQLGLYERDKEVRWKLFDNKCISECPEDHVADEKNETTCLKCDGSCPKVCRGIVVDNIASAQSLKGCTRIDGSLEIKITGGQNIVIELEESLSSVKEVDHYVKITRSFPLISLNFMKNIEKIHGKQKIKDEYSLYVLENNNLQELIETNTKLQIVSGKVFFHNNPKLCKHKIVNFLKKINFTNWNHDDVSSESNGDRIACTDSFLKAEVSKIGSTMALIQWSSFKNLSDHRFLIGYVVSYKEAPFKNVSLYDGRDACGTDTWKVDDVSPDADENTIWEYHILTNLKPFTQYAVSIKTYTISKEQDAQSDIIYFQTLPDTPSSPVDVTAVSTSSTSLIISWLPPTKPNGTITYYTVIVKRQPYNEEDLYQRNYCSSPLVIPDPTTKQPTAPELPSKINITDFWHHPKKLPENCCECPKERTRLSEEEKEKEFVMQVEDMLQNYVYVKKRNSSVSRQKRNFEELLTTTMMTTPLNSTKYMDNFSTENSAKFESLEVYNNVTKNTSVEIRGLQHFTEYLFEIKACQDTFKNRLSEPCSSKSLATSRTLKKVNADDIDSTSVSVTVLNDTSGKVFVKWKKPIDPNGLIVTYQLEYAKKNIDNLQPTRVCITQSQYLKEGGYKLNNLDGGNYSIRIHAVSLAGEGNWTTEKFFVITKSSNGIPSHILIASIVGGIVCFLIIGSFVIYFIIKKSLHKIPNGVLYASVNPEYMSTVYVPDEWEISRDKITLLRELGQGSFGMVYEGIIKDLEEGKHEIRCAIKTVNETATLRERIEFLNEASVMKAFSCHHVVRLIGVVSKGQPTFVVMELMANGDLKSYLRLHRPDSEDAEKLPPPTLKQILQMACEIADGMAYLANKKFVHRDLAARNCMVSEDLTVKIGDFGMTRDIYETDYYRKGGKGLLPVRWMAPESLKDGVFTSQSDVWSYGIVLWEMATLASQPYQGLSNEQVLKYVVEGGIMEKPENCPDRLYNLMAVCWSHNPKSRPSFLELVSMLVSDASPSFHQVSFFSTQSNGLSYDIFEINEALPTTPLKMNVATNPAVEMNSKPNSVNRNNIPFDDSQDCYVEAVVDTKENAVPVAEGSKSVRTTEPLANGHIHFPLTNNVKC